MPGSELHAGGEVPLVARGEGPLGERGGRVAIGSGDGDPRCSMPREDAAIIVHLPPSERAFPLGRGGSGRGVVMVHERRYICCAR